MKTVGAKKSSCVLRTAYCAVGSHNAPRTTHYESGSALILTVILTALLAILGAMFLLSSRANRMSTSSIAVGKDLDLAVDTVIAQISTELVFDVPHNDPCRIKPEYYDYPGDADPWLASLEPNTNGSNIYFWPHISDIYLKLASQTNWKLQAIIKPEYQLSNEIGDSNLVMFYYADADGDGVTDSVWTEVPGMKTHKGERVYTAVRVVDNGGMLNVNTAYLFNPLDTERGNIDGRRQSQINLMALSARDMTHSDTQKVDRLWNARCPDANAYPASTYEEAVTWRYGTKPAGYYTPFDISDELKLRYRYMLNYNYGSNPHTRIEKLWTKFADWWLAKPLTDIALFASNSDYWFGHANNSSVNPDKYDYRHIATTYNIDRIIDAVGDRMVNINSSDLDANDLYHAKFLPCIDPCLPAAAKDILIREFAQAAANIRDYGDEDSNVSTVYAPGVGNFYGFESPCIYISELVCRVRKDPVDPNIIHRSYGIELRKQFGHEKFDDWKLIIGEPNDPSKRIVTVDDKVFAERGGRYFVQIWEDPAAELASTVKFSDSPDDGATGVDPDITLSWEQGWELDPNGIWVQPTYFNVYFGTDSNEVTNADSSSAVRVGNEQPWTSYKPSAPLNIDTTYYWRVDSLDADKSVLSKGDVWNFTTWLQEPNSIAGIIGPDDIVFGPDTSIMLTRNVPDKDGPGKNGDIIVDAIGPVQSGDILIPYWLIDANDPNEIPRSFQRDIHWKERVKRLWDIDGRRSNFVSLGSFNDLTYSNWYPAVTSIQPFQQHFNNIGEIGFVFKKSTYYEVPMPADRIQITDTEAQLRLDVENPTVQKLFQYLTVIDPNNHINDPNETRIKGRININTAPWFVIAQLPWVSQKVNELNYGLASAIISYRDKLNNVIDYSGGRTNATGIPLLREEPGFASIGELTTVINNSNQLVDMRYYALDKDDQKGFPDLNNDRRTKLDGVANDFEERDLIFARMSDLVTVRSDVFTAYILIRIGNDGPQRRVMAILDRSGVKLPSDKVKIVSLYQVPDPR